MKRMLGVVALSIALVAGLGLRAEAAFRVGCGSVLPDQTKDTVFHLKHNLTCPSSFDPAITLGDHTILDLKGHRLNGSGTGDGVDAIGKDHAAVRHGSITNFVTPVNFSNGNADQATRLKILGGFAAVNLNGTSHALVAKNRFTVVGLTCVDITDASDTTLLSNRMSCHMNGVTIGGASMNTLVDRNRISHGAVGIDINTTGLAFTRVIGNTVRGGTTGIFVAATGVNETITGNKVAGASSNGIDVPSGALTIAIGGNASNGNGHDGISVLNNDAGTSIGGNVANGNGNYGIEATAGTDDAGGNRAKANGAFYQCIFVVCQ